MVLITGGTSGIGHSIVSSLCQEYSFVNLSRSLPKAEDAHGFAFQACVDFSEGEVAIRNALSLVKERFPQIHGIVGCSGVQKIAPVLGIGSADLNEIFNVNLFANIFLVKHALRLRLLSKNTSVVMISSIAAKVPEAGLAAYGASKAALDGYVKVAATELASRGIRVNSVRPGLIETNLVLKEKAYSADFLSIEEGRYPLGLGRTSDVAHAVRYLLSDDASWITGQAITVDGGRSLG